MLLSFFLASICDTYMHAFEKFKIGYFLNLYVCETINLLKCMSTKCKLKFLPYKRMFVCLKSFLIQKTFISKAIIVSRLKWNEN